MVGATSASGGPSGPTTPTAPTRQPSTAVPTAGAVCTRCAAPTLKKAFLAGPVHRRILYIIIAARWHIRFGPDRVVIRCSIALQALPCWHVKPDETHTFTRCAMHGRAHTVDTGAFILVVCSGLTLLSLAGPTAAPPTNAPTASPTNAVPTGAPSHAPTTAVPTPAGGCTRPISPYGEF